MSAIEQIKKAGTSAVPFLIEALKPPKILSERTQSIRITSALLLGKTEDKRAFIPLTKALKDRNRFVREASCLALSYLKRKEAIPYLKEALKDRSGNVRMRAALALARLGDTSGKELAIKTIAEDDVTAQLLATEVLEELKAEDAIPTLLSYIKPTSLSWTIVHSYLAIAKIEASVLTEEDKLTYYDNTLKTHNQFEVAQWASDKLYTLIKEKHLLSQRAEEILKRAIEEYQYPGSYCAAKVLFRLYREKI
jgi:HEAT repeat protein